MLKRNRILVAFLVITILCASIVFAAVADTLAVNGDFDFSVNSADTTDPFQQEFDADIYISNAAVNTTSTSEGVVTTNSKVTFDPSTLPCNTDTLRISIANGTFTAVGQELVIDVTISNASTVQGASLSVGHIDSNLTTYATVTANFSGNNTGSIAAATSDSQPATTTLTVTVRLDKIPATDITDATFSIPVTASAAN